MNNMWGVIKHFEKSEHRETFDLHVNLSFFKN